MDLFIQPEIIFEKVGAEVTLPEDPNAWPNEITQELFKQVPYIADFEPHVVMDRVDAERGFGFGHVEVMNKTQLHAGTSPEGLEAAGIKQARIPIIVQDRKLQPLDVLITEDSKMLPLTESRLRQAIFRPGNFDITAQTPGDISMVNQLYPPNRGPAGMSLNGDMGPGMLGKMGAARIHIGPTSSRLQEISHNISQGMKDDFLRERRHRQRTKAILGAGALTIGGGLLYANRSKKKHDAEKRASVLQAILPTISESDYGHFFDELSDRGLRAAFVKNAAATLPSLQLLGSYTPVDDEKVAASLLENIRPSVVQLVREPEGYRVKAANHRAWAPREEAWDRKTAVRTFGEKIVLAADLSGSATMMPDEGAPQALPPAPEEGEEGQPEPISEFGVYAVQDEEGNEMTGHVFPNLIDVDGKPLPLALFWNGEHAAVQTDIVGAKVGEDIPMVEGPPQGHGAFYDIDGEEPVATIPLTIHSSLSGGGDEEANSSVSLMAETFDGRHVTVVVQPNLAGVTMGQGAQMLVPDTMKWLPLDECQEIVLMGEPETAEKMAHPTRPLATVFVRAGGGAESFSIDGMPVEKIAVDHRHFLSTDDALFLLAGLGVQPNYASVKLAQAMEGSHPVEVRIGRSIQTAREAFEEVTKLGAHPLTEVATRLKFWLVKEAATIPDPTAVDTVLSLGFINPDNMSTFVAYLPELEEAQQKMCELLIASRLGLKEVPANAVEKAVRSTEQVLEGLKILAFQSTSATN